MAERRPDPTNPQGSKKTYTKKQFTEFYGAAHAAKLWKAGGRLLAAAPGGGDRRRDPTTPSSKKTYTRQQFVEFYGAKQGATMWKKAGAPAKAPAAKKAASPQQKKSKFVLKYFDARGIVEPVRVMFALRDQAYEDKRYGFTFGTPGDFTTIQRPEFDADKAAGHFDSNLGRLPVLVCDSRAIPQSKAIGRFVAARLGLLGKTEADAVKVEAVVEHISDFRTDFQKVSGPMNPKDEKRSEAEKEKEVKEFFLGEKGLKPKLALLDKYIGKGPFCLGKRLSQADVVLWAFFADNTRLQGHTELLAEALEGAPKVKAVAAAVAEKPRVKAWLEKRPKTMF